MIRSQIITAHNLLTDDPQSYVDCANYLQGISGSPDRLEDPSEAMAYLEAFYRMLLNADRYVDCALFLFGSNMFNPEPMAVQATWNALTNWDFNLIIAGGSQGKTYNVALWVLLSWLEDPEDTAVKIISVSMEHAARNIFASIKMFHQLSVIPLPGGEPKEKSIEIEGNKRSAIVQVAIPEGIAMGKGRLRGFHPVPRRIPHPKFGKKTRVIVATDEGEDVAHGLWEGLENIRSTEGKDRTIKIAVVANPKDRSSPFAQRIVPDGGWEQLNVDTSTEWDSAQNWHVTRIDPARTENILEKREVYEGFMTYEGWLNYVRKGTNNPDYYTFARGWYPETSAELYVVPFYLLSRVKGTYIFVPNKTPINVGSLDPAFEIGGDEPIFTAAKYGLASGIIYPDGKMEKFPQERWAIQVEQQFALTKGLTQDMAKQVVSLCADLHIRPEWFVMDESGNAKGLADNLRGIFGTILTVKWAEKATERKILLEDSEPAEELYSGVVSEMWFAFSHWVEYGYLRISPMVQEDQLWGELSGRRFDHRGVLRRVETKDAYKVNSGGNSPDHADSLIMIVHLIRLRGPQINAAMLPELHAGRALTETEKLLAQLSGHYSDPMAGKNPASPLEKLDYVEF